MMPTRWECGESVRVIRNVRNDGTYPGLMTGAPLVKRGSIGHVIDIGTFLQDQIIYSVHFLTEDRIVGCREEELIDPEDEWIPSLYEFREQVCLQADLPLGDGDRLPSGSVGEILKVLRIPPDKVAYHIHFDALPGRLMQIPEGLLKAQTDTPTL
jgi:nitrogen fixation protein NifZ